MNKKDEVERILDHATHEVQRAKYEILALLSSEPTATSLDGEQSLPPIWMDEDEVIKYVRCAASSLRNWRSRPADQHPFPFGMAGDMLRFNRADVDRWLREEGELKRYAKSPIATDEQPGRRGGLSAVTSHKGGR